MADPRTSRWRIRPAGTGDQLTDHGFVVYLGRRKFGDWFRDEIPARLALQHRNAEAAA